MAFVPEYEHDLFVSYAHVDDRPFLDTPGPERALGWVATLVRHLKNELAQKVGRDEDFAVWFDTNNLRGNHALTDEIAARLQRSATFLAILSSGYLASSWCRDEARTFSGRPAVALHGGLFVVEKSPLDEDAAPPAELSGRRNYRFWYRDRAEKPRTLAVPMPHQDEIEYFRQVEDVARDIHSQLKLMRLGRSPSRSQGPQPPLTGQTTTLTNGRLAVLLAEARDDLEFRRLEVQRYLEQQGVVVLPEAPYPMGRVEFERALDADLTSCRLFAQLLGPVPGKRPRDVPEGYGWLQYEGARRRGLPVLQWRSPELELAGVEWPRHRELLELATVQATSLESFKRALPRRLPRQPQCPNHAAAPTNVPLSSSTPKHATVGSRPRSATELETAPCGPSRFLRARQWKCAKISSKTSSIAMQWSWSMPTIRAGRGRSCAPFISWCRGATTRCVRFRCLMPRPNTNPSLAFICRIWS